MAFTPVGTAPTIASAVTSRLLAPLGAPTLPVELEPSNDDLIPALQKYYAHFPIKITKQHFFTSDRETLMRFSDIVDRKSVV